MVRCEDVIKETRNRVRVDKRIGEYLWTEREVRKRYSISPILFNLLIADF